MAYTNFWFVQRRFALDQVKNCYPAFNEQFDFVSSDAVIWRPYTESQKEAKYPGGISDLCTGDRAYWMALQRLCTFTFRLN